MSTAAAPDVPGMDLGFAGTAAASPFAFFFLGPAGSSVVGKQKPSAQHGGTE